MFDGSRNKKTKHKITVKVQMDDGRDQTFYMFVAPNTRVADVLNDERPFLPLERMDGSTTIVRKTSIRSVDPIEALSVIPVTDPYDVIGVDPTASDEQIQEAYRRAVAAIHPDRVQSLGLPREFLALANHKASLINEALAKIKKQRAGH